MELVISIIMIVGWILWKNYVLDNYPTHNTSTKDMLNDAAMGASPRKIRKNLVSGKYDLDKDKEEKQFYKIEINLIRL